MRGTVLLLLAFVLAACGGDPAGAAPTPPRDAFWPDPPATPDGALDPDTAEAVDRAISRAALGVLDQGALETIASSGDARLAWLVADMLRFVQRGSRQQALLDTFTALTGTDPLADERFGRSPWPAVTNLLIGWDLPEPPGYREHKATLFLPIEPRWEPFFADADAELDWRIVSWGGVYIDDRPPGDTGRCSRPCIPSLEDPVLTPAAQGDWYADDRTVFGVIVGDEAVAFPKHIMEVHEMVNLTIGGRRVGMPYCTLCGAAQAYATDAVPDGTQTPVLRTSGLLSRSNKVMYDLVTRSLFNTFTGRAVSGPLREAGVVLEPLTVTVSTWGDWKTAHPHTMIVAQDGGIGAVYPDDPLGGRDDDGPIFPTGPVDTRLPTQVAVLGVIAPDGTPIAFPVEQAIAELDAGRPVVHEGVELLSDGAGLRARLRDGEALPSHEAFWFAWSQFHPSTAVWRP
jgi:hypothetical protein